MKIALITIHSANSYGGILQAYATQTVLSDYGNVSIIDYSTPHLQDTMRVVAMPKSGRGLLRFAKNAFRFFPRRRLLAKFKDFQGRYFNLTPRMSSWFDLCKLEDEFDVFVCGSDQIWNPKVTEKFDLAYFLGFINKKKKISYGSSPGSYTFNAEESKELIRHLGGFSFIGVREDDMNEFLSYLLKRKDITTVLDPTLLLSREQWLSSLNVKTDKNCSPYLLVYALKIDSHYGGVIKSTADKLGLRIVSIDQEPFPRYPVDDYLNDVGPIDFINLIANASFVVTDSFHGTAFSINFNVPFVTLPPSTGRNRVITLLRAVNLTQRLIDVNTDIDLNLSFAESNILLDLQREKSFSFLDKSLLK
ncbi:MAG: polysaccharide pyruvyl transferase family protein [Sedimentibacter sp.]